MRLDDVGKVSLLRAGDFELRPGRKDRCLDHDGRRRAEVAHVTHRQYLRVCESSLQWRTLGRAANCVPRQLSRAPVRSFKMRPILLISLITPDPTNTAHTWMAEARTSGNESAEKAGVSAAAIGA